MGRSSDNPKTITIGVGLPEAGSTNTCCVFEVIVPQTDTSGWVEYTQVDEIIMVKELGKMTL